MINKNEILKVAKSLNLLPSIIEKDYVLGWVLMGINKQMDCNEKWVFKGGTCLKKCFFDNYRFSEDLDFTLLNEDHMQTDVMTKILKKVGEWVYEESGIEILEKNIKVDLYKNPHGAYSIEGKLTYIGPLKQKTNSPRIKLDLTAFEKVFLPPELRQVFHNFSDRPAAPSNILSYCYEEIFAEKLRALAERARPRDLYDVIHLFQWRENGLDKHKFLQSLAAKCEFKKIAIPSFDFIDRHPQRETLSSEWKNMLSHQLPKLKPFEYFWDQLPEIFEWMKT